jgi:hypothetical protein
MVLSSRVGECYSQKELSKAVTKQSEREKYIFLRAWAILDKCFHPPRRSALKFILFSVPCIQKGVCRMSWHAMQPNAAATKLASSCMHGGGGLVTYGPDVTYGLNTDSARC